MLNIANTKYLEDGEAVSIEGVEYNVTEAASNTSITIEAGETGLVFTDKVVEWSPYEKVSFDKLQVAPI